MGKRTYKLSEEHRRNLSISHMGHENYNKGGYNLSEETKKKIGNFFRGKTLSDEHKQKVKENHAKYWLGKKLPIEVRIKMSEARKGEKNHLWRGGITKLRLQIRNSFQYRQWINEVFIKDNFTCKECNKRGGRLSAHH